MASLLSTISSKAKVLTKLQSSHGNQITAIKSEGDISFYISFLELIGGSLRRTVPKSDVALLSAVKPTNSGLTSGLSYQWASQTSLLSRTTWTRTTFHRVHFSTIKSRRQELRVLDEEKDDFEKEDEVEDDSEVLDEQQISDTDDYEVLDEQRISDSEDDQDLDEEQASDNDYVSEDDGQQSQSVIPSPLRPKKKFEVNVPKPKPINEGPVLNEKITARTLRLVDDDGRGHRVILRDEALLLAKRKKMDLVLVDRTADPPVCKIFDFNRVKYQKEQTMKDRKKKKGAAAKLSEIKELRYSFKTELKDLKMKVDKARQFLERGYKVKFVGNFQAHIEEMADRLEQGKIIHEVISMMDGVAFIEQGPRFEARLVWVIFKHTKFGKPKKKPQKPAAQPDGRPVQSEPDDVYATASLQV